MTNAVVLPSPCLDGIRYADGKDHLLAFLKGGEVENYKGVEVEWIRGRKATMTIYEDGKEVETVDIYELTKHDDIVKMMEDKGFRPKTSHEALQERILKSDLSHMEASSLVGKSSLYMIAGTMALLVVFVAVRGRAKERKLRLLR